MRLVFVAAALLINTAFAEEDAGVPAVEPAPVVAPAPVATPAPPPAPAPVPAAAPSPSVLEQVLLAFFFEHDDQSLR